MHTNTNAEHKRFSTGVKGLDAILDGGLPQERLYVIQGAPGTGKTTLALQFLLEGVRSGQNCLYVTFSETKKELLQVAHSHGLDISKIALLDLSSIEQQLKSEAQNTMFHPSEVELGKVTQILMTEVEQVRPERIVFDSISELLLLSESSLRYRKQILELKQAFLNRNVTVLFLDDLTSTARDLQIQSIAHGVIQIERIHKEFGLLSPERMLKSMESTDRQVNKLSLLIENLLDVSRIREGKFSLDINACNLSQLTKKVLKQFSPQIAATKSSLQFHGTDKAWGYWDPLRIEQVIANLISNAIKYGQGKPIQVSVYSTEEMAILAVQDQGPGISPEDHGRIFERFERVASKNKISGLGLGLYIVRQIIEMHGGKIWVQSTMGKGSLFKVELPLHEQSKLVFNEK